MRRVLALAAAIWLICGLWAWAGTPGEPKTVSFNYKFNAPQIETNGDVVRLTMADGGQLHTIGQPAMPFRTARLLIPRGCRVEKAEAVSFTEAKTLEGTFQVEYAGEPNNRPGRGKGIFAPGLNRLIYDSDAPYPASAAELLSVQKMAGYEIALVRVFPAQYRPKSGKLVFTPELSVRLQLGPAATNAEPAIHPPNRARAAAQVAEFVDNPELLRSLDVEQPLTPALSPSEGERGNAGRPLSKTEAPGASERRSSPLPLPVVRGEGRGEGSGERRMRQQPVPPRGARSPDAGIPPMAVL